VLLCTAFARAGKDADIIPVYPPGKFHPIQQQEEMPSPTPDRVDKDHGQAGPPATAWWQAPTVIASSITAVGVIAAAIIGGRKLHHRKVIHDG